jgi:hypothetical protein
VKLAWSAKALAYTSARDKRSGKRYLREVSGQAIVSKLVSLETLLRSSNQ